MFHFLEARMATMLRTSRSLLRWARRHLMKGMRQEEWIRLKALPSLRQAAQRGDVDLVMKAFTKDEQKLSEIIKDLDRIERNVFLSEYSAVKQVDDLSVGFSQALDRFKVLRERHPEMQAVLTKLEEQFTKMREELRRYEGIEMGDLHKQYLAVARQAEGEHAQLQTFVFAASSVMKVMDELWNLRGQIRRERSEEKALEQGEHHVLALIAELGKASPAKQKLLLAQLQKQEHRIEEELDRFLKLFKQTEEAFTTVLKVCVEIYFQYVKDEESFARFMSDLRRTGFPEHDFEKLLETVENARRLQQEENQAILDVVRRGARLQGGKLSV